MAVVHSPGHLLGHIMGARRPGRRQLGWTGKSWQGQGSAGAGQGPLPRDPCTPRRQPQRNRGGCPSSPALERREGALVAAANLGNCDVPSGVSPGPAPCQIRQFRPMQAREPCSGLSRGWTTP